MRHIFISYGQKDTEYVQRLQEDLVRQGFSVWMDERFDHDAPWPKIIQDHLNNCDALILIVSENSFESEWVPKEVARAKRIGKPVFPILLNSNTWPTVELTQGMDVENKELLPENHSYPHRSESNDGKNPAPFCQEMAPIAAGVAKTERKPGYRQDRHGTERKTHVRVGILGFQKASVQACQVLH